MRQSRAAVFAGVVLLLGTVPARGTIQRTFVSRNGLDTNTCAIDQPCRSFAILQTNANGEIVVNDSAGYGPVTITKAVAIVSPLGVHAGISVFSGDGVTVNGASTDVVVLRNLYINAQGGVNGITLTSAAALHIEHCLVSGFSSNDINLTPTGSAHVAVSDTIVRQAGASGIYADSAATLTVSLARSDVQNNSYGVVADRAYVAVQDSDSNRNAHIGFYARGTAGAAHMTIQASVASNNVEGVEVGSGVVAVLASTVSNNGSSGFLSISGAGKLIIDGSTVVGNYYGVLTSGGSQTSISNSTFSDNTYGAGLAGTTELVHNTITRNTTGILNGTALYSSGDNVVDGNGTNYSLFPGGTISAANKM